MRRFVANEDVSIIVCKEFAEVQPKRIVCTTHWAEIRTKSRIKRVPFSSVPWVTVKIVA